MTPRIPSVCYHSNTRWNFLSILPLMDRTVYYLRLKTFFRHPFNFQIIISFKYLSSFLFQREPLIFRDEYARDGAENWKKTELLNILPPPLPEWTRWIVLKVGVIELLSKIEQRRKENTNLNFRRLCVNYKAQSEHIVHVQGAHISYPLILLRRPLFFLRCGEFFDPLYPPPSHRNPIHDIRLTLIKLHNWFAVNTLGRSGSTTFDVIENWANIQIFGKFFWNYSSTFL